MKKEDLISIISKLNYRSYDDFENEHTAVLYEVSEIKYEVTLKRIKGKIVDFSIKSAGGVANENT